MAPEIESSLTQRSSTFVVDPWSVVLLGDGGHTFDEVTLQLIKALNIALQKASEIALEAHNSGEAVCYTGPKAHCEYVVSVLKEIDLSARIERVG